MLLVGLYLPSPKKEVMWLRFRRRSVSGFGRSFPESHSGWRRIFFKILGRHFWKDSSRLRPKIQLLHPLYSPGSSTVLGGGFRSLIASNSFYTVVRYIGRPTVYIVRPPLIVIAEALSCVSTESDVMWRKRPFPSSTQKFNTDLVRIITSTAYELSGGPTSMTLNDFELLK